VSAAIRTVDLACMHCGARDDDALWAGCEHEYDNTTDEQFQFVRCRSCGLVRLNPRPDISELGRIYPPDYYAYNLAAESGGVTNTMKRRMYQRRIESAVERLGRTGPIRLLDVGCGDGRLLDWYKGSAVGARLETHGIELSESAADVARRRGHRVVAGRFEVDRELEEGAFDLILAAHVIEHVEDPVGFAERAAALLAPGGMFVIATPNWDSVDARRLRGEWGGNHFPRHWALYDERTVRWLADAVGLLVERIEYQPNPIFWIWSCHAWLRARFPGRRWPDRLFPPVRIFAPSLQSFALQSLFTMLDVALHRVTGRTASMAAELRKPRDATLAPVPDEEWVPAV
jgi:2-polyprenyl-3-methyl-5-hydroxy-6-metoxy-1,4-benzoquinol methylase